MNIPELGVGIIYFPGFENVLASNPDLIQVIEIEPQTFWYRYKSGLDSFVYDAEKVNYLKSLHKPLLFHGVGYPIGGTIMPNAEHLPCLKKMMTELQPIWMSEHLSFNTLNINEIPYNTNFLLPPLQTQEGIERISASIRSYASHFDMPFAFETGTNYLSPKKFELDDGYFVDQLALQSETYILFDIHNLLANHKNGRQPVFDYLKQVSHEKIIQIHLAGGFYFKNYYLDAHSNVSSDEVLDVFEKTVELLPNLKAVTFEMGADYLNFIPEKAIRKQLEKMNTIWERRGKKQKGHQPAYNFAISPDQYLPDMSEWEQQVGLLALGREIPVRTALTDELEMDKGFEIIRDLIEKFKGSAIVSALKLTCRYIMLYYSVDELNQLLKVFWETDVPKLFASDNGIDFADFLLHREELKNNDLLMDLITYEKKSLLTLLDQTQRDVKMTFDPTEIIPFLAEYKLPESLHRGNYIITLTPEEKFSENIQTVFHS
jgi:uncharacterized protein (UPF0276 family)